MVSGPISYHDFRQTGPWSGIEPGLHQCEASALTTALSPFPLLDDRDLEQSGRQRQGRLRLKNEFLPLIRISKMAACVYRLIRRHTSTSA